MSWKSIPVGRALGIPVKLHFTFPFFVLLLVLVQTLSSGLLAGFMMAVGLVFLFLFVLLHELGHSVVARRYGVPILDITLLPIGGLARTLGLPRSPKHEILIALAGPAVNLGLALPIWLLRLPLEGGITRALLSTLLAANLMLAGFNLVPAFPLDGGRVFRALLALRWGHLRATIWAVRMGWVMSLGFVIFGLMNRDWIMLVLIGLFLVQAGGQELKLARRIDRIERGNAGDAALPLPSPFPRESRIGDVPARLREDGGAAYFPIEMEGLHLGLLERGLLEEASRHLDPRLPLSRLVEQGGPPLPADFPLTEARRRMMRAPEGVLPVRLPGGGLGLLSPRALDAWMAGKR